MIQRLVLIVLIVLIVLLASVSASAQLIDCNASSIVPPLEATSTSSVVGDILLTCIATPTSFPALNDFIETSVLVFLTTNITNAIAGGVTDAVLIVNENHCDTPSPTGGVHGSCGAPDARFQDPQFGVLAAVNRLEWHSVEFPVPGAGAGDAFPEITTLRIRLIRSNVAQLGLQSPPVPVNAFVSLGQPNVIPVRNNFLAVGLPVNDPGNIDPDGVTGLGVITCTAMAVTAAARARGFDERIGDLLLSCQRILPPPADRNY